MAAVWLFGGGAAQAGGAGADLGGAQDALNSVCTQFGVSSCPQLPTINQLVLENAAVSGSSPAQVRTDLNIAPGGAFDAGTAFVGNPVVANPLNFITPSNPAGLPIPTGAGGNALLTATTSPDPNSGAIPGTLNLLFNFKPRTNSSFALNQDVGDITLPFAVTDGAGDLLRQPLLTVQIRGAGGTAVTTDVLDSGGGLAGTPGQKFALSDLGITSALDFSQGNEIFSLDIPLIGFDNLLTFPAAGFRFADGLFEGIDPIASFLDGSFADDNGGLVHAFHADLAIAFDGTTLLSDPLPAPEPPGLALIGAALLALALVRRRFAG
ncbi:MAG: hypothetical protein ACREFH_13735 [Stellaceae bacterium]